MAVALNKFKSTIDLAKVVANRECLIALRNKPFTITPSCVLQTINQELTGTARAIYLHLYARAEQNFNAKSVTSPVIISAKTLADLHIFKSERTVRRRLNELETKGFIVIQHRINKRNGSQESSAIWPIIPERLRQGFLAIPNRRTLDKVVPIITSGSDEKRAFYGDRKEDPLNDGYVNDNGTSFSSQEQDGPLLNVVNNVESNLLTPRGSSAELQENNNATMQRLAHEHYIKLVAELQSQGLGMVKAGMQAYGRLSKEEKVHFVKYIENQKNEEKNIAIGEAHNCVVPHDKNGIHKIYNNYIVNSSTAVDNFCYQNRETIELRPKAPVVNLNQNITNEFIGKQIRKFKEQIPTAMFARGKTIEDIVLEVQFHVENRALNKTKTPLHALNAAKGLLRQGLWQPPLKYIYAKNAEAIERERLGAKEKASELEDLRRFINNSHIMEVRR